MTKRSKGKDRFARNADKLNQINANAMYEQLLTEQEAVKAKKGIKPKVKGIPAYADGKSRKLGKEIPLLSGEAFGIYADALKKFFTEPTKATTANSAMNEAFDINSLNQRGGLGSRKYWNSTNSSMTAAPYGEAVPTQGVNPITGETMPVGVNEPLYDLPEVSLPGAAPITKVKSVRKPTPASKSAKATNSLNQAPLLDIEDFNPSLTSDPIYAPLLNIEEFNPTLTPDEIKTPGKSSSNFGSLSGLSPILYNWIQSRRRPETEDQVLNPYTGAINRAMASRRVNIEPTLAANRRSRAIARNNMAKLNPNTGMNLAYGNQLATGEYAQNASVYANRDNANNQYLGEYANMMNNLGQQYVQNTVLTNDLNARNRAAARNFGATAAGQLGQWSQTKEKMRNQARRDRQILPYLQNFLRYGTVNSLVDSLTV